MERTHAVHMQPVWRDRADFIIDARLDDGRILQWEQLWVRQLAPYQFEVCCIPFFVYDLALGDQVETGSEGDKRYVVQRVVRPSGHQTFRIWFGGSNRPGVQEEVIELLLQLGCLCEWYSENLLAADAPNGEVAQSAANQLYERELRGELEYETGRTA